MKRLSLLFAVIFVLGSLLVACGEESPETNAEKNEAKTEGGGEKLSQEEFEKVFQNTKEYIGSYVEFFGRVFTEPERDSDGTYLQVFADNNSDRNVLVGIMDPDIEVATDDIIHVKGTVHDVFEGENAFGALITAPMVLSESVEITDYQTAFAPAKTTVELDEEQNHNGYKLTVQKIELADEETRVYVRITNDTDDKINFFSFNAKITADGKQLEVEDNFDADYPDVQSELLPGTSSEGIVTFPALPEDTANFQIHFEGSSDNWELDIDPFVFEVDVK